MLNTSWNLKIAVAGALGNARFLPARACSWAVDSLSFLWSGYQKGHGQWGRQFYCQLPCLSTQYSGYSFGEMHLLPVTDKTPFSGGRIHHALKDTGAALGRGETNWGPCIYCLSFLPSQAWEHNFLHSPKDILTNRTNVCLHSNTRGHVTLYVKRDSVDVTVS